MPINICITPSQMFHPHPCNSAICLYTFFYVLNQFLARLTLHDALFQVLNSFVIKTEMLLGCGVITIKTASAPTNLDGNEILWLVRAWLYRSSFTMWTLFSIMDCDLRSWRHCPHTLSFKIRIYFTHESYPCLPFLQFSQFSRK